ncbi:cytochrome c oxidase subunit 3 [Nocardioides sp. J54]|uniref:cytochrome c oxidase subunit 3 n=1 Tax=Nocardioides sp. J54 TaxID=935866 RepID=UPI00048FEE59|nr:cytochrome c oxidase subunit 3 [Nocardioides sp. J54]
MTAVDVRTAPDTAGQPERHRRKIPGEVGIWMFIGGDMISFSFLFFLFLHYRANDTAGFTASQAHLDQNLGLLNTLLMLTSSWLVASGVRFAARQRGDLAARCFLGAVGCAAAFAVVKAVEWGGKVADGHTMSSDEFFMFYYCCAGIHMIHVVIGSGVLLSMAATVRRSKLAGNEQRNIESGATFWHLVDLLWIVLFALLYLVGQS